MSTAYPQRKRTIKSMLQLKKIRNNFFDLLVSFPIKIKIPIKMVSLIFHTGLPVWHNFLLRIYEFIPEFPIEECFFFFYEITKQLSLNEAKITIYNFWCKIRISEQKRRHNWQHCLHMRHSFPPFEVA